MDELSPLFHDIEFNERFRGYDVEEVDAYVDRVAKAAALVQGRIAELQERVVAAESQPRTVVASSSSSDEMDDGRLSRVLVLAQRTADAAIEEAKAEAEAMRIDAGADAERMRREADDHASLVLAEAETDRRRIITEAEAAAAGAVAAERARVAAEVAELERHRAFLSDDIAILEQHLADTRLSLSASLSVLTDLLETPESFRAPAMPATSGVEVPAGLIEGRTIGEEPVEAPAPELEPVVADAAPAETAQPAVDPEPVAIEAEAVAAEPVDEPPVFEPAPLPTEAETTFDPSEPTQVFDAISIEPSEEAMPAPAATAEPVDPAPEPAPVIEAAARDVEPVAFDEPVAPADFDQPADVLAAEEPVVADEPDPVESSFEASMAPETPTSDDNRVFDIDLLDEAAEPVVDLTEPVVDLVEPDLDPGRPDTESISAAAVEPTDGDAATATAPPRLVTAEDIDTGEQPVEESGAWIDELRDAAEAEPGDATGELLFAPPESTANDHFLDQLRDAVGTDEPEEFAEDALAAFFDDGDEDDGRGWFNRRR